MSRFFADSFKIHPASLASALTLRNVSGVGHDLGIQMSSPESGAYFNEVRFVSQQQPQINLTALALESLLNTVSLLDGLCIEDDTGKPGLQLFGQQHAACTAGGRTTGSTHMQVTAAKGHLLVTQLQGNAGADATATLRAICLSEDGAASPTAVVYNAALPSTLIVDEVFTVGKVMFNGTLIPADAVQSVSIDTGINVQIVQAAASIFPTAVVRAKADPTITIELDDASYLDAAKVPYSGLKCLTSNCWVSFAKREPYGGVKNLTDAEHIKIQFGGYAHITQHAQGSGASPLTTQITINGDRISGNNPLVVTTQTNID